MKELGLLQVYTGDGKGKTTASLGLAFRAIGHGQHEPAFDAGQETGKGLETVEGDGIVVDVENVGRIDEEEGAFPVVAADAVQCVQALDVDPFQALVDFQERFGNVGQVEARTSACDVAVGPA